MARHRIGFRHSVFFLVTCLTCVACDKQGKLVHRIVSAPENASGESGTTKTPAPERPLVPARPSTAKAGSISYNLQSTFPQVLLELPQELDNITKKPATMTTFATEGGAVVDDHIAITIRYRGNSSFTYYPKKQYLIEIKDTSYQNDGLGLLDFPGGKDWVLYAPYGDKSLVRNVLAYNLFNKMGHYAARTRFVTLMLKDATGTAKNMGIYVLMEKIHVSPNRVAIGNKSSSAPSSYLMRFDYLKARNFVTTDHNHDVIVDYPKAKNWDDTKKAALLGYLNGFESRLFSANQADFQNVVNDIDLPSFVDFIIMQELTRNIDAYNLSCNFYLPLGGRLTFGPVWDFEKAFGNAHLYSGWMTNGFHFQAENDYNWFKKLLTHPAVKQALKDRWSALRAGTLSDDTVVAMIDEQVGTMTQAAITENFAVWNILGVKVWPNYVTYPTYGQEVDALKVWLKTRMAWLDSAVPGL